MRRVGWVVTAGAALLVLGACSNKATTTAASSPSPSVAGPQTFKVLVDGHTADNKVGFLAYFPKEVSVHPGDTVTFHSAFSGEPHTVAIGTAIDTALNKVDAILKANPKALDNGPPPPELAKLPQLLPQGPGDAIQAAAQPCVVEATGTLPKTAACPTQALTAGFDGTQQLTSSGWLAADQDWSLAFSPTAKPGKYRFMCQLHGPEMTGAVTVVDSATTVKDAAAVEAQGISDRAADIAKMKPAFDLLATGTAAKAYAGTFAEAVQTGFVAQFGPSNIKIPVGGSVSWTVLGGHSIAFNAPADAQSLRIPGAGGVVHVSQKAAVPAGGPGADPSAQNLPPLIDGGTWNGVGFRNSGLIFGGPPPHTTAFKLTFSKAGTYAFICTVHVDMKGTVTVG